MRHKFSLTTKHKEKLTMNDDKRLLEKFGRKHSFTTPEGYFDDFTARIMDTLPEKETPAEPHITMWQRVKPWVYMAAMFCGLMLSVRLVVGTDNDSEPYAFEETISGIPVEDIDAIMDKTMLDDYTLYQYLTEADFEIE